MGCDFWWRGAVPDPAIQERMIRFLPWFSSDLVLPNPELTVPATIEATWAEVEAAMAAPPSELVSFSPEDFRRAFEVPGGPPRAMGHNHDAYPFNFFGIAPRDNDPELWDRYQFVFDRSNGGRLVTLLPINPSCVEPGERLIVKDGGYERCLTDHSQWLALALEVARLRYCTDLVISDDYENCKWVRQCIERWDAASRFCDETLCFDECSQLFGEQLRIHDDEGE